MTDQFRPQDGRPTGDQPQYGQPQYGPPAGPAYGAPQGGSPWGPPQPGDQHGPPGGDGGQYGPPPGGDGGRYGPPGQYGPPPGQYGQPGQYGPPPGQYGLPGQYGPPGQPGQQGPYGQPGQYGPPGPYGGYPQGQPDLIHQLSPGAPTPRRSKARALWATVATGTAVVLTAGGVYAYSALSGSNAVLPAKVPGDAVAYLEVNLDPPAAQKIAAIRFLRKFPDAKTGSEDGSLLDSVIEPLIEDPEDRKVYVENIEPWLGKHAAVVADPQDGRIRPVVVAETTDPGKTRSGLDAVNRREKNPKDKVFYAIEGDIVYLAETQEVADRAAKDAGSGTLESSGTFTADVDKVGDGGIVTFWADLGAAAELDKSGNDAQGEGRVAGSLTFTDTTADLTIRSIGNPAKTGSEPIGDEIGRLPATTAAAVGISGADDLVRSAWEQAGKAGLGSQLSRAEQELDLELPDDLAALVGSSTVFAAGDDGSGDTGFGLVSTTDDPAGAKRAADVLIRKLDRNASLAVKSTDDGTVLASSEQYATLLAGPLPPGSTALSGDELFRAALPDLDSATAVVYLNVERTAKFADEEVPKEASGMRAFGLTASSSGGESTVHLRLVAG